jgi:hypothetical protein
VGSGGLEPPIKRLWAVSSEIEQQAHGDFLAARKAPEWWNCCEVSVNIEIQDNLNTLAVEAIVRRLRLVHPPDGTAENLPASDATPCEALGEGIDLIVMAPGKSASRQ